MPRRVEVTDHYAMTEAELKAEIVSYAHEQGWLVFSLPMSSIRRLVKDASGYPDLTLAREGRVLWFELKAQAGKLSEAQAVWIKALRWSYIIRPSDLAEAKALLR